jgi:hypothetical protein
MPLTNGYTTLDALRQRLAVPAGAVDHDAILESIITAASRSIDNHTGRRFYAATETRYYSPADPYCLLLPSDLRTVTTLKTDEDGDRTYEITWSSSTDYLLTPYNAAADGLPYSGIEVDCTYGDYRFPLRQRSTQIVGSWGYCATGSQPAPVEEACLRLAERLYKLRDAPLGVAGSPETGVVRIATDRDIADLLWPYTRRMGFA